MDQNGRVKPSSAPYDNRELLLWVLDPVLLCAQIDWYPQFLQQNKDIREYFRVMAKAATFTGAKSMSKEGLLFLICRIPSKIAEIAEKCGDPELDGRNFKKLDAFLKDHPEFDLRVTAH